MKRENSLLNDFEMKVGEVIDLYFQAQKAKGSKASIYNIINEFQEWGMIPDGNREYYILIWKVYTQEKLSE